MDRKITEIIHHGYAKKFSESIQSNVLIVGGGPSGLTAGYLLRQEGLKVVIIEKRLAPGGGIWGGGMGMNEVVVEEDVLDLLDEFGIRYTDVGEQLYSVDAVELASGLTFKAVQSGAVLLNRVGAEDVCIADDRVSGVVINQTDVIGRLPVDPVTFTADAVLDATGHEAVICSALNRRRTLSGVKGGALVGEEGMDARKAEEFVVENTGEIFPGLWISGMGVCSVWGGPRMGPIFGGMLSSGRKVAGQIAASVNAA